MNHRTSLAPLHLNLHLRRPFFELTLKVNGVQLGIALGRSGLLVVLQRLDRRWLLAVGNWGSRR